jgi:hypothetical protein
LSWAPLLDGDAGAQALDAVRAIATDLPGELPGSPALADGLAGLAVTQAYLERADLRSGSRAVDLLGRAIDAVVRRPLDPALFAGFAGVAWAAAHLGLARRGANDAIDAALIDQLGRMPHPGGHDLVGGVVGCGVYALEQDEPARRQILELVVDQLAAMATRAPGSRYTWLTPPAHIAAALRAEYPEGRYDCGLAHGVAGVIALLGAASAAGVATTKARALLDGAVSWLLAQRDDDGDNRFPASVAGERRRTTLVPGWCSGDLGVAIALVAAARATGDLDWEAAALDAARAAAARDPATCTVYDTGFCHGSAGVAHLFNRLHQATGEAAFAEAARAWLTRLLGQREPGGIGGFFTVQGRDPATLSKHRAPGLLMGAAGIALVLLAAASDIEPAWDRVFLTSVGAQPIVAPRSRASRDS